MKGFQIKLKAKNVKALKAIISKGKEKARKITRCRILLLCHEKKNKSEIASMLSINANTVSNTCRRYIDEGLESKRQSFLVFLVD